MNFVQLIRITLTAHSRDVIKEFCQTLIKLHIELPLIADKLGSAVNGQKQSLM